MRNQQGKRQGDRGGLAKWGKMNKCPLLLTAKLHYVKESVWEILESPESDILPPTPQPC